jgi:hypothetical protein
MLGFVQPAVAGPAAGRRKTRTGGGHRGAGSRPPPLWEDAASAWAARKVGAAKPKAKALCGLRPRLRASDDPAGYGNSFTRREGSRPISPRVPLRFRLPHPAMVNAAGRMWSLLCRRGRAGLSRHSPSPAFSNTAAAQCRRPPPLSDTADSAALVAAAPATRDRRLPHRCWVEPRKEALEPLHKWRQKTPLAGNGVADQAHQFGARRRAATGAQQKAESVAARRKVCCESGLF